MEVGNGICRDKDKVELKAIWAIWEVVMLL